jgi:hypothetical protein
MNLTCRAGHPSGTLAGEILIKNLSSAIRTRCPGQAEDENLLRQFTNRRMRTFIATPSARKVNKTEDPP